MKNLSEVIKYKKPSGKVRRGGKRGGHNRYASLKASNEYRRSDKEYPSVWELKKGVIV